MIFSIEYIFFSGQNCFQSVIKKKNNVNTIQYDCAGVYEVTTELTTGQLFYFNNVTV